MLPIKRTHVFEQESDSMSLDNEGFQTLTISTEDAGGGPYLVIETERWAIDISELDEFVIELKKMAESIYGNE